jgi:hypothetical protein
MLEPDFSAPFSARLSAGVSRSLGAATTIHVSAALRRSESLPRRSDLNLLQLPAARDQYGRGVFGTLNKQGGLLYAAAGTGRRFPTYDEVALISDDGWSEYWGVTLGVERQLLRGLGALARYTYGRTTDNWFGAAEGGWSLPAPAGLPDADWVEGTSDLDVPHRLSTALVLEAAPGLRLAGVYRFQSGRPFTPGFHTGVDADASGGGADPAFVDPALPGMSDLLAAWDCLADSENEFAARNSCRGDPVHALDLGVSFRLFRFGGASTSIAVDAFNVLETEYAVPDAALYLVDPAAPLVVDVPARTVTVPLLVNPNFGAPLVRPHTGRRIRLGILLNW